MSIIVTNNYDKAKQGNSLKAQIPQSTLRNNSTTNTKKKKIEW